MIVIDIPMPENCMECPCAYMVRTGKHEGETICEALEKKYPYDGFERHKVDAYARNRPDKCLMCELGKPTKPEWRQGEAFCGACGRQLPKRRICKADFCPGCGRKVSWE